MPDQAPHTNPLLERQALGQILGFAGAWDLYLGAGLEEADFFTSANRLVFRAMAAVVAADVKPDLVTVGLELRAGTARR
jgi:replicative DNA helicase